MTPRFSIETPTAPGAVAMIRVACGHPSSAFEAIGIRPVGIGCASVRAVLGVDHALVAHPDRRTILLMPHGGPAIVRTLADRLSERGLLHEREPDPARRYPEAGGDVEARMLDALARAASPLAVDVLLGQPRRWRGHKPGDPLADGRVLARLLDPPRVVAVGPPNIGKSSLLNALAGESVALAFDRAGTTRDPVGVLVDLGGLVVRWVDTPGIGDGLSRQAAAEQAADADLLVWCADARAGHGPCPFDGVPTLDVLTRADLSGAAAVGLTTSAISGVGIDRLAGAVRDTLVPPETLDDPSPWRFWSGS